MKKTKIFLDTILLQIRDSQFQISNKIEIKVSTKLLIIFSIIFLKLNQFYKFCKILD